MRLVVRSILFLCILTCTALPAFGDAPPSNLKTKMKIMIQKHPELMQELMTNPAHRLAMAYRDSVMSFGLALKKAAQNTETVPGSFVRSAAKEMKRGIDMMEKQHDEVLRSLPAEKKALLEDMPALMHEHLGDMRKRLDHLDELAKSDQVPSPEVLKELDSIMEQCQMGMPGMHGSMPPNGGQPPHHAMLGDAGPQDAELQNLVRQLKEAPDNQKMGLISEILTRLVEKRSAPAKGMHHPMMQHQQMDWNSSYPAEGEDDMNMDEEMDDTE